MPRDPLKGLLLGGSAGEEDADDGDSELDAAKDILAAFESKDAKGLSLALKRHYEACQASDDEPADDEDDDGDF